MGFSDYNSNPDLNVSISGVNIGEGCPPSGINNAIRQIMADAKTADGGYVKNASSGAVVSNGLTVRGGATISGGLEVGSSVNVNNGRTDSTAHSVTLGANANGNAGLYDHTYSKWLLLNTSANVTSMCDGAFVVDLDGIRMRAGTPYDSMYANFSNDGSFSAPHFKSTLFYAINSGGSASVHVEGQKTSGGILERYAMVLKAQTNGQRGLYDPFTSKWALVENSAGSVVLSGTVAGSSDERLKGGIATIPDKTLDAWSKVDWRQYRYKADGAGAPVHFGVVAQHVSSCLAEGGVNPSGYALIENKGLHGEGPDEWAVYYQEAFALEAAYQRRRADKAEERIAALERRLDALEAAFVAAGA